MEEKWQCKRGKRECCAIECKRIVFQEKVKQPGFQDLEMLRLLESKQAQSLTTSVGSGAAPPLSLSLSFSPSRGPRPCAFLTLVLGPTLRERTALPSRSTCHFFQQMLQFIPTSPFCFIINLSAHRNPLPCWRQDGNVVKALEMNAFENKSFASLQENYWQA